MKKYKIVISDSVAEKIKKQAKFIITNNIQDKKTVISWVDGIYNVINSLAYLPDRFPLAVENNFASKKKKSEIRKIIYKKTFKIIYDIDGDEIRILNVIHSHMNTKV